MNFLKKFSKKYGSRFAHSIISTTYAKKNLSILFVILLTSIIKLHITFLLSLVFTLNPYFDYCFQIVLSVGIHLQSYHIYNYLLRYNYRFYRLTRYLINNYTEENMRRWKKYVILSLSFYLIVILYFTEITSFLLIIYIIQYLIIFLIIDIIEQKKYLRMYQSLSQWYHYKKAQFTYQPAVIIEDYYKIEKSKPKQPTKFVIIDDFKKEIRKKKKKKEYL